MNRRALTAILASMTLGFAQFAQAQTEPVARVGYLSSARAPTPEQIAKGAGATKLRELGWVPNLARPEGNLTGVAG